MEEMKNMKIEDLSKRLRSIKAQDIMSRNVLTVAQDMTLAQLADFMIKTRVSGLPVIGEFGEVAGVITTTDLFMVMDMIKTGKVVEGGANAVANPTVKFAMSTEVMRIKPSTSLEEIITIMKDKNIHTLPVFEAETMVGVIGRRDVFKHFYSAIKDLTSNEQNGGV